MNKVSFIKSSDRIYGIQRSLSLIKSEIISGVKNAKRIVIKPNCVHHNVKLAATHVDALFAVLDFVKPYTNSQITLAEGTAIGETMDAFKNFGYLNLQAQFDLAIVDLNNDNFKEIDLIDKKGRTIKAKVSTTILDSDYLISVSPPKTHNAVVYTGAVKNVSVGALIRPDRPMPGFLKKLAQIKNNKTKVHQGYKATNENIRRIYDKISLKLAVLDGFEAMEGNGPVDGEMVPSHFTIASSNGLSADYLACQVMGIHIDDVGYLKLLGADTEERFIIGDDWQKNVINFKLHDDFTKMKNWR
jgi:uncharacterized protein (DUF362 family)